MPVTSQIGKEAVDWKYSGVYIPLKIGKATRKRKMGEKIEEAWFISRVT